MERSFFAIPLFINLNFMQMAWPWVLSILILSFSAYFAYYYGIWRERKRKKILDQKVMEKTEELIAEKQQLWESYMKIEYQNEEKKVLIQEVHHRVKNNLQTISSLIGMQLTTMVSEEGKNALQETLRRLNAMSLVHEMLYASDSLSHISSRDYFEILTSSSLEMYNNNHINIQINVDVIDVNLEVSTCISLGMVASEAISNCMVHAFKGIDNPTIWLNFSYAHRLGWLSLSIKDNGCGIPGKYIKGKNGSMGMRLINIFTRQLKAEFRIENHVGTEIILEFKTAKNEDINR